MPYGKWSLPNFRGVYSARPLTVNKEASHRFLGWWDAAPGQRIRAIHRNLKQRLTMQSNFTTHPTGGQLANDGILAGRELESDAELIALGWLKPTAADLFEGDELSPRYPDDDAREDAERRAERNAERQAKLRAERDAWLACFPEDRTAFELGLETGLIGGQTKKMVRLGIRDDTYISPTEPKSYNPPSWSGAYCLRDDTVRVRLRSDVQIVKTCFNCGDCGPCVVQWRYRKRHRYEWGITGKPEQTVVIVSELDDDGVAADAAIAIGRAGDGRRVVFLARNPSTYYWQAVVIFADPQPVNVCLNIERGRTRNGQQCSVETRQVLGTEIEQWLPTNKRSPDWHKPCRFVNWDGSESVEREYQYGDGYVADAADVLEVPFETVAPLDSEIQPYVDKPTDTNAKRTAKLRARNRVHIRRWLTGVTLDIAALLLLRDARRQGQRGDWFGCIESGTYHGPRALVIDLALALDDDGMVSLDTPDGLRLASSYITEGVE